MKLDNCKLKVKDLELTTNINLDVQPSECAGIIAVSGFGKTSLFRALLGVNDYYLSGQAQYGNISYIPQSGGLVSWLTIKEHGKLYGLAFDDEAIDSLGLKELCDEKVRNLSGGQYHRALLLIELTKATDIVCLDEPLVSLDILTKEKSIVWIKNVVRKKKLKLVVASHDIDFLYSFCDKVYLMRKKSSKILMTRKFESEECFKKEILENLQ